MNPYQSPREAVTAENPEKERKKGLQKFSPFVREIVSYVRAIIGGFLLVCFLYLFFWDPDYSPFMALVVLPIVIVMGIAWGVIETFILPRYCSRNDRAISGEDVGTE